MTFEDHVLTEDFYVRRPCGCSRSHRGWWVISLSCETHRAMIDPEDQANLWSGLPGQRGQFGPVRDPGGGDARRGKAVTKRPG